MCEKMMIEEDVDVCWFCFESVWEDDLLIVLCVCRGG